MSKINQLIRRMMMAYPSLYANRFEAFAELMTNSCYEWNKDGELVASCGEVGQRPKSPEAMIRLAKKELAARRKELRSHSSPCLDELHKRFELEAVKEYRDICFRAKHIDLYTEQYTDCGYKAHHKWLHYTDRHGISSYWSINNIPENITPEWRDAIREWLSEMMASMNMLMGVNTPERWVAQDRYKTTFNWVMDKYRSLETEEHRRNIAAQSALAEEIIAEILAEERNVSETAKS